MSTNRFLGLAVSGIKTLYTAITTSTGVSDANKIVATGDDGRLDASLMPPGIGALTEIVQASEALAAGDFVNIWTQSGERQVRKADASNTRAAHGFVLSSVSNNANATVYLQGLNNALSGLTPGAIIYLTTTAGTGSATPPAAENATILQTLGTAVSTTSVLFEYDAPILF